VVAVMAMLLMTSLGSALILLSTTESRISANMRAGTRALFAAEAGLERALVDLLALPDPSLALSGALVSAFTDGPPGGRRSVGGAEVDLTSATSLLQCGRPSPPCSDDDMDAVTADRPWGRNNPRWRLFAWGAFDRLVPGPDTLSDVYLAVWVADDQGENDGDPLRDGVSGDNPGNGVLVLTAHAYGATGVRRRVEATVQVGRAGMAAGPSARIVSWREVR
jgi:hypothetical protein